LRGTQRTRRKNSKVIDNTFDPLPHMDNARIFS